MFSLLQATFFSRSNKFTIGVTWRLGAFIPFQNLTSTWIIKKIHWDCINVDQIGCERRGEHVWARVISMNTTSSQVKQNLLNNKKNFIRSHKWFSVEVNFREIYAAQILVAVRWVSPNTPNLVTQMMVAMRMKYLRYSPTD